MLNCIFNLSKKVTAEMGKANIKATNLERKTRAKTRTGKLYLAFTEF